ncbi:MAG: helix-turn-helix domain-containing protein [Pseudonocardiaceae bacterium]
MDKDTLNRIERGLRSPTLAQLHALAEALQAVSPLELSRRHGPMTPIRPRSTVASRPGEDWSKALDSQSR